MIFKKMFSKDCQFYLEKGKKYLAEERYADARHAFLEGMEKLAGQPAGNDALEAELKGLLDETGNRLGRINLEEAERALTMKDCRKAVEHLDLVAELALDPAVRESAAVLRERLDSGPPVNEPKEASGRCSGCATDAAEVSEVDHVPEYLLPEERFELLIQTIPIELRDRYASQGDLFTEGYLLAHGGHEEQGAAIFRELLRGGEDDIILYELALTCFKAGMLTECEDVLNRALTINSVNPLCCLALVQLLTDTGRLSDSLPVLHHMIENRLLLEQSLLFLGDVHVALDNEETAIESYSQALALPNAARSAAERLIPILENRGRRDDAAHLFGRYLKGCC
jgi:tetratricopeptide (TPR) repeat protein